MQSHGAGWGCRVRDGTEDVGRRGLECHSRELGMLSVGEGMRFQGLKQPMIIITAHQVPTTCCVIY